MDSKFVDTTNESPDLLDLLYEMSMTLERIALALEAGNLDRIHQSSDPPVLPTAPLWSPDVY